MLGILKNLWLDNRKYFYIGCILMLAGILIGIVQADKVDAIAREMLGQIKQIADKIGSSNNSLTAFRMIFINNVLTAFCMMIFGVLFAIFPVYGIVTNGILLGYMLHKLGAAGLNTLQIFSVAILPHGIIELPAVIFAAGIGIRYGALTIRSITSLWDRSIREEIKAAWLLNIKQFPVALLTIVFLLAIAGVIESVITPALIKATFGTQVDFIKSK
ncbi:stage II sporulation protein M [Brevibacillus ginsengisoli]|uniref:stage II sporulation protein M n=1 Tax=Brevibacillus ginsengisoli TaxID=363854 RepID=UPI003CFAD8F8